MIEASDAMDACRRTQPQERCREVKLGPRCLDLGYCTRESCIGQSAGHRTAIGVVGEEQKIVRGMVARPARHG